MKYLRFGTGWLGLVRRKDVLAHPFKMQRHSHAGGIGIAGHQCSYDALMVSKTWLTLGEFTLPLKDCGVAPHLQNRVCHEGISAGISNALVQSIIELPYELGIRIWINLYVLKHRSEVCDCLSRYSLARLRSRTWLDEHSHRHAVEVVGQSDNAHRENALCVARKKPLPFKTSQCVTHWRTRDAKSRGKPALLHHSTTRHLRREDFSEQCRIGFIREASFRRDLTVHPVDSPVVDNIERYGPWLKTRKAFGQHQLGIDQ